MPISATISRDKTPWGGAIRYAHPDFGAAHLVVSNPGCGCGFHIDGFGSMPRMKSSTIPASHSQELTASIHAGGLHRRRQAEHARLVCPKLKRFGFDAVWADDFHHVVRVANTHEAESYLGDLPARSVKQSIRFGHG